MSDPIGGAAGAMHVTHSMLASLRRSRPWIMFLSVVGFGSCCLLVLLAIIGVVMSSSSPLGVLGGIPLGLLYMLIAVVYFFPSLKLYQSAAALKKLEQDGQGVYRSLSRSRRIAPPPRGVTRAFATTTKRWLPCLMLGTISVSSVRR